MESGTQKFTFLEALFVAILIFGIGILAGVWLESYREGKVNAVYAMSEINMLDMASGEDFIDLVNCNQAQAELIEFADRVYNEARMLERYEGASRLSENLIITHTKYDLLRASLFLASIKTKSKCNSSYHVITYLYDYQETPIEIGSRQNVFSKYLLELKESEAGKNMILIPIAVDNNLMSVDLIIKKYNITEFPTILVDEKTKISSIEDLENLKSLVQ